MQNIIEVNNLVKKYKKAEKNSVDNISFNVKEGEFFTLLGPNGAGKTTTISMLTTTLSQTSGSIKIAGFDVKNDPAHVRQNIGIIFQKPSLDENLTAEENIRMHANLYGVFNFRPFYSMMPKQYKEKVDELASILGIEKELHNNVKTFSGGMKRKMEIVRSLIHNPKILFLDEPTSGLDPESRKKLWKYLVNVKNKENITIFLTTHYLEEAEEADRTCIIYVGKILALEKTSDLKNQLLSRYILAQTKEGEFEKLKNELSAKNIKFNEDFEHFTKNELQILLNGDRAQKIIKQIDTELIELEIHTPTLEEAYLEILEKAELEQKNMQNSQNNEIINNDVSQHTQGENQNSKKEQK